MGTPTSEPDRKRVRFNGPADKPAKATLTASSVVQLRFVHSITDVHPDGAAGPHDPKLTTNPPFLHQIFPKGVVHGWHSLTVAIYVHLGTLSYWIDVHGQEGEEESTKVKEKISPFIKGGLVDSRQQFEMSIMQSVDDMQNAVGSYAKKGEHFTVYRESFFLQKEGGDRQRRENFLEWHRRMAFLMFVYIDGASFIDDEDPRWEIYVIMKQPQAGLPVFVGYATVYVFSSLVKGGSDGMRFVDRIRVSQVFISPLETGKGHGRQLMGFIYENAQSRKALEVAVEGPCEGFRVLRDVTDLKRAYEKGFLQKEKELEEGLEEDLVSKLRTHLLLTVGQAKRSLEVHQLKFVDRENEEQYKKYRLWVKRRLFKENYEVLHCYDKEERKQKLSEIYEDLEKEYLTSIIHLKGRRDTNE